MKHWQPSSHEGGVSQLDKGKTKTEKHYDLKLV